MITHEPPRMTDSHDEPEVAVPGDAATAMHYREFFERLLVV